MYTKLPFGSVPDDYEKIFVSFIDKGIIDYEVIIEREFEKHNIIAKEKYDKTCFNEEELNMIKKVLELFKVYMPEQIVDFLHQEKAFMNTKLYHFISYEYTIDLNID